MPFLSYLIPSCRNSAACPRQRYWAHLKNPVQMMFVPSGDAQAIVKGGQEVVELLKKETGLHFKTSIATSYAAVIEAMGAGKVDIGWPTNLQLCTGKRTNMTSNCC